MNMYDELEKKDARFDYEALGKMIGIPMIPTVAAKGKGINELLDKIIEVYEDRDQVVRHIHINYGEDIEHAIKRIQQKIKETPSVTDQFSSRYLSVKLLENDSVSHQRLVGSPN